MAEDPGAPVSGSKRTVRMSGQARREQLIRIGREVFAERGYQAASVEEIAERAAISKPVVYEHFGGKDGLHAVIIDRAVGDLLGRIQRGLQPKHPREAIERTVDAFLGYVEEEEAGFRVLVHDGPAGSGSSLPSLLADVASRAEGLLEAQLMVRGYDRRMAPVLARALVGTVSVTAQWWLEERRPSRQDVTANLVNLIWNGLKDLEPDGAAGRSRGDSS